MTITHLDSGIRIISLLADLGVDMAHPMGESKEGVLRLDFNRRLKLGFHGSKVVAHGRYVTFQLAEVAVPRSLFREILRRIEELRPPPPIPA